ncbi:MAG TPA: DUF853 family protein [Pirellulaceae bacterium]|nr:DUF853 family protein [Pirellulaceae bacterium]
MTDTSPGAPPLRLTVSQARMAAACPRLAYFDADHLRRQGRRKAQAARLWKQLDDQTVVGLGRLFHTSVERFQRKAVQRRDVARWIDSAHSRDQIQRQFLAHIYRTHVTHSRLFSATGDQQQAFIRSLRRYTSELTDIVWHGRTTGRAGAEMVEQMFGDQRREVDVSFEVGPHGRRVNVYGRLDDVFFDLRTGRRRIIDYKLMPPELSKKRDLTQVNLYALMHDVQHGTRPDAAVLYLHPRRELVELPWSEIAARRGETLRFLASLREWLEYDEDGEEGLKPPGDTTFCQVCPWKNECTARLGPKTEGGFVSWDSLSTSTDEAIVETATSVAKSTDESSAPTTTAGPISIEPAFADTPSTGRASDDTPAADAKSTPTPSREDPAPDDVPAVTPDSAETKLQLCLGTWQSDGAPVTIDVDALTLHGVLTGAAGSGKTWTAKVLIEEAVRCGVPVIAIDPQGDLAQMYLESTDDAARHPRWSDARREYLSRREVRVWTPGSRIGIPLILDPLRLDAQRPTSAGVARADEIWETVLTSATSNLVSLANARGELESQQTLLKMIMGRLSSGVSRQIILSDVIAALREPESIGIVDADDVLRPAERKKLARLLNNLKEGSSAALFRRGVPLDLDRFVTPLTPGRTPLNVIYLNHLADDRQKQFLVAAVANEIYRWMQTRDAEACRRVLFFIDEARDFLPAGTKQPPAKIPLRRLFSQARKYGIACVAATQSPRTIEYEVLTNCSTKLIGKLASKQDVDRVRDWFSGPADAGGAPEWLAGRKDAQQGTFVGRWPKQDAARDGATFTSRPLFSWHRSAWTPDDVEEHLVADSLRLSVLRELDSGAATC